VDSIQDHLHAIAASLIRTAPLSDEKVRCAWQLAVGPSLSRVSTARADADGTIRAVADDAPWKREIVKGRDLILSRLRAALGPQVAQRLVVTSPGGQAQKSTRRAPRK
jgi:hypothetical protein